MLLPRLQPPLRIALTPIARPGTRTTCLNEAFAQLTIKPRGLGMRYASHKAQGAVNKAKDGPGKRLGAKKSGEQYVIPGNIIFRQRGTHWFPGDNCAMGRDHTIYATESGYVKYYKDPGRNPDKQYIGVVFERDQVLPLPRNAPRRRKLNMVATKMETPPVVETLEQELLKVDIMGDSDSNAVSLKGKATKLKRIEEPPLALRPGGMYRMSNWEIGRAAEREGINIRPFKPRDRWVAWRKAGIRNKTIAEKRSLGRKKGKK